MVRKVLIMGAAGKDFHVFNTCYRGRTEHRVVAFTATQIPHIDGRRYPPSLAGSGYPDGIPIHPEEELQELIRRHGVDNVVLAYSDVSHAYVAERRKAVEAAGARFATFDVDATMLSSSKPVVAVCAVRTGCGKSQTSRRIVSILRARGWRTIVVRHPMPYGDLEAQRLQRFERLEDLQAQRCTIEEMEEYEPHLRNGAVVYGGVDYAAILAAVEKEADVVLWDGGNNDTPFYRPSLWITLADPHRPGHETSYFPGSINFERADLILINKADTADPANVAAIETNARRINPRALVVTAASPVSVPRPGEIRGKRVLVIEDGPTVTHGEMAYGAGIVAAKKWGASEILDPRLWAVGEIADTFRKYPQVGPLLPAMGYGERQMADLAATIDRVPCDLVLVGTPIDLARIVRIRHPSMRVTYELAEHGDGLERALERAVAANKTVRA